MGVSLLSRETGDHWTASANLDEVHFWTTRLTGSYRVRTGTPNGVVLLQFDLSGNTSRRIRGTTLGGDDILVASARTELEGVLTGPHHGVSLVVPDDVVTDALVARTPRFDRLGSVPLVLSQSVARLAALRRFAAVALDPFSQNQSGHVRSLMSGDALDLLMNALVSHFDGDDLTTTGIPNVQRLPIVRRVEEFMRAHLGDRLMLHDLCRVARASQRTVEYAFSSIYGMGPKQYLRILRLNEVRRTFRTEPPEASSIKDIAYRHGLWHLGHFTTDYRRLFGETPDETRARRERSIVYLGPPGQPAVLAGQVRAGRHVGSSNDNAGRSFDDPD